jgi:hypothetical protein
MQATAAWTRSAGDKPGSVALTFCSGIAAVSNGCQQTHRFHYSVVNQERIFRQCA